MHRPFHCKQGNDLLTGHPEGDIGADLLLTAKDRQDLGSKMASMASIKRIAHKTMLDVVLALIISSGYLSR